MIILDCSAAIEIARGTELGKGLQSLFLQDEDVVAPSLFAAECGNVCWKYVRAKVWEKEHAKRLLEDALALPDRLVPMEGLMEEAFAQGVHLEHSVYDMVYMILARRMDATMVTCDGKLQKLCQASGVDCITEVTDF